MKFVWKDDVLTSSTENKYTVKNDNNEIVYEGRVPVIGEYSEFYLNRIAEKLMEKGTVDFTTGVTSHPEMSIGLTVYNENEQALKNEVYVNAFNGEPTNYLSNPINGKLDPRMMFLWTLYGQRASIIAINEPQPPQPGFILELSGTTAFTYEQQSSEITVVQCTDWDGVSISKSGEWFNFIKTRTGVILSINENSTDSARTGSISFSYNGSIYTSITLSQSSYVEPPAFVLELSGNTMFNHRYQSSVLYVTECTDWNSISVECDANWIIATKVSFGVYLVIQENSGVARISPLRFYSNGRLVKTVDILQIADFSITLSGERNFYYPQQQSNIYVVQCTDWDPVVVQTDADWFTMEKTSTGVTLYIQENTTESSRTAQINFYYFSLLVDTFTIHQLQSSGWENEYFTTIALSDGYIGVKRIPDFFISRKLAYRKNYGEWVEGKISGSTYTTFGTDVSSGDVVEWKAVPDTTAITGNSMFGLRYYTSGDAPYKVCGNLLSLAFGSNYKEMDYPMDFSALFFDSKGLVDAVNLALPSTVVGIHCYRFMFKGCTSLTAVPYILPATALTWGCYENMFSGCTSLVNAPVLPATVLARECYSNMFKGCTSLTTAPELPATTLAENCYEFMFKGCTSLTTAPELPATTLTQSCYQGMFDGCTSLNYVKCLAETFGNSSTVLWLYGVSQTGTFVKKQGATWETGASGIPNNWTVEEAV